MLAEGSKGVPLKVGEGWIQIPVRVQPRASSEGIAGIAEGALKVRLTAPPVEGRANQALCDFLARTLGIPKGDVAVVSGEKSRLKRIRIRGVSPEHLAARLPQIPWEPDSSRG
jgi:uncharacterized protein (TIGR00251 family)